MNDRMTQRENVAVQLACGHPHKKAGEQCELCGQTVPDTQSTAVEPKELAGQELKEPAQGESNNE